MVSQFVTETHVPIRTFAKLEPINPDIAVGHDAVEVDEDALLRKFSGESEMFAVPANASWKKTTCASGRIFLIKGTFDAPIMWNIEFAPVGVVEHRSLRTRRV